MLQLSNTYKKGKLELSNLRSQFGADQARIDSLDFSLVEIEKEISRNLSRDLMHTDPSITWEDVRDVLQEGEAAVEIIHFNYRTAPPNRYHIPWYYAFIITPDTRDHPSCIPLYTDSTIFEGYHLYRESMESTRDIPLDPGLYEQFWSPLDSLLGGFKRIYFSPDRMFHAINIEALRDSDGEYLLDKYEIVQVNSLVDLLKKPVANDSNRTVLLAGDPAFSVSMDPVRDAAVDSTRGSRSATQEMFRGLRLSALPGTRAEVDHIAELLDTVGWDYRILKGAEATEDAVAEVSNPRILHLATHGYFAENQESAPDSISLSMNWAGYDFSDPENQNRSSLFFAGAQNTLFYAYDYDLGKRDGILTAWEISEMELDSTELVVLSACETGLGDYVASEGIQV